MGLFDSAFRTLFGGSEQESRQQQQLFGPQADFLRQQFFPFITGLSERFQGTPESLIASFSPTQEAGQTLGTAAAFGALPQIGGAQSALQQALRPETALSEPLLRRSVEASLNPFIRGFREDIAPLSRRFGEDVLGIGEDFQRGLDVAARRFGTEVLPGIRSQAVGVGQVGGSREAIAQGLAGEELARQVGDIGRGATRAFGGLSRDVADRFGGLTRGFGDVLGNIVSQAQQQAFGQGIQQRLGALGLAPQITGLGFLPGEALRGIGAEQQALEQQRRLAPFTLAQQLQQLAGPAVTLGSSFGTGLSQRGITQGLGDIGLTFGGFAPGGI